MKIEIGNNCMSRSLKGTNKNIIAKFDKIWLNMFRTGRDVQDLGQKTLFFTPLKIEIGKKFISISAQGTNTNVKTCSEWEEI